MLKKEKKKVQDAAARLVDLTGQRSTVQVDPPTASTEPPTDDATDVVSTTNGGRAVQYMKRGTHSTASDVDQYHSI